jgi:hypothetical protein
MGNRQKSWRRKNRTRARIISNDALKKTRKRNLTQAMLAGTKWRANKRGLEFDLEASDISIPEKCPVLGIPLKSTYGQSNKRRGDRDSAPSIDRIDNSRGYTRDNIIIVSGKVNRIKSNASVDELETIASFYRGLQNESRGMDRSGACTDKAAAGDALRDVPAMLGLSEEKVGKVSVGNGGGRPLLEISVSPLPMAGD